MPGYYEPSRYEVPRIDVPEIYVFYANRGRIAVA